MIADHTKWMGAALDEARKALVKNEVPIGAVIVHEDRIIGRGHNLIETLQDPTAHAEMLAITGAANALASWRLENCILYATLEPCPMCVGAILLSRLKAVIYGTKDPRYGACGSAIQLVDHNKFDVKVSTFGGICEAECRAILKEFFVTLRQKTKPKAESSPMND